MRCKTMLNPIPVKFSFKNNILIAFILICAGVIFLGQATYRNNLKYKDTANLVEHAQEVLYLSEQVLSVNQDIETANRGYLLTNNEFFLQPLHSGKKAAFTHLTNLKNLTNSNTLQQTRVDRLFELTA